MSLADLNYIIPHAGQKGENILISDVLIDESYVENYGLKTTQNKERMYWRISGELEVRIPNGHGKTKLERFRINVSDIKGLKTAIQDFMEALKNNNLSYEIKASGIWNNGEEKIAYDSYLELRISRRQNLKSFLKTFK